MQSLKTTMRWLHSFISQYSATLLLCLVLTSTVSCNSLPVSLLLPHKGTNVAANTQLGQNNSQVLGQVVTHTYAPPTSPIQATTVDQSQGESVGMIANGAKSVTYNQTSKWLIIVALLGWILPTPQQMVKEVYNATTGLFKRPT